MRSTLNGSASSRGAGDGLAPIRIIDHAGAKPGINPMTHFGQKGVDDLLHDRLEFFHLRLLERGVLGVGNPDLKLPDIRSAVPIIEPGLLQRDVRLRYEPG